MRLRGGVEGEGVWGRYGVITGEGGVGGMREGEGRVIVPSGGCHLVLADRDCVFAQLAHLLTTFLPHPSNPLPQDHRHVSRHPAHGAGGVITTHHTYCCSFSSPSSHTPQTSSHRTTDMSVVILPMVLEVSRLFGGFFVSPSNMPVYFKWLQALSYCDYTYVVSLTLLVAHGTHRGREVALRTWSCV